MGRFFRFFLVLLLFQSSASASPWHYGLLEDLQKAGSLGLARDEGDMRMSFGVNYPKKLVLEGLAANLRVAGFPLESENPESVSYFSHWKEDTTSFGAKLATGWEKTRIRFRVDLQEDSELPRTSVTISVDFEAFERGMFNSGWRPESDRGMRDIIRQVLVNSTLYCRYPSSRHLRMSVSEDYRSKNQRVGRNGYELPAPEKWIDKSVEATKKCPFCAETILSEAIKCKHCGEFLGSDSKEFIGPSPELTP